MTLRAATGYAQALDGREAGLQATHLALNLLGTGATPALAITIASHHYDARQVVTGISSLLGDVPTIGFSSPAGFSTDGQHPHTVSVGILSGSDMLASSHWLPSYAQSSRETAFELKRLIRSDKLDAQCMLTFADGFNGDAEQLCGALGDQPIPIVGGLSSGDLHTGHTYQIAGSQTGTGGLSAMLIRGDVRIGIGSAHGWLPAGRLFKVTRSRGFWVRTLDGRPASETYAQLFGYPAREWAFPPLNHFARLYPLGIERHNEQMLVRSPMRVEADGSFRMNASIRDGQDAQLLIGSPSACLSAAAEATQKAIQQLDQAKPVMALVLVDIAWSMLLEATPGAEIRAVQNVLGEHVPIIGGYTLGQIVPGKEQAHFFNQHMVVILFGEN